MIIVDKYMDNIRPFEESKPGDCFISEGGYFMRTDSVADDVNAVNLTTGEVAWFFPETQVKAIRMKAEVI